MAATMKERTKSLARQGQVSRTIGYVVAMGHEEAFMEIATKLETNFREHVEGFDFAFTSWDESANVYSCVMVFESLEKMDAYKLEIRDQFLEEMKPHLVAGPIFNQEGEVRWFPAKSENH